MSDTEKKEKAAKEYYFKSRYSGLKILLKDGESVRFQPFYDTHKGDRIRVGYLATSDPVVVKRCEAISAVESITEKEYKDRESLAPAPVYS